MRRAARNPLTVQIAVTRGAQMNQETMPRRNSRAIRMTNVDPSGASSSIQVAEPPRALMTGRPAPARMMARVRPTFEAFPFHCKVKGHDCRPRPHVLARGRRRAPHAGPGDRPGGRGAQDCGRQPGRTRRRAAWPRVRRAGAGGRAADQAARLRPDVDRAPGAAVPASRRRGRAPPQPLAAHLRRAGRPARGRRGGVHAAWPAIRRPARAVAAARGGTAVARLRRGITRNRRARATARDLTCRLDLR